MKETWKDIIGYDGKYQISDYGNVKSIARLVPYSNRLLHESILSPGHDGNDYCQVGLSNNGRQKMFKVHKLVMLHFVGQSDLTIDHLDGNKDNNKLDNLEYVTQRENVSRHYKRQSVTSKYTGVFWDKKLGKFRARIFVSRKGEHLGCFVSEELASRAYQIALDKINTKTASNSVNTATK